ncbi:MAG: AMP-binding protein [Bacteroidaceae bacterium]|nr:AMP-binding protein [Bacteroidaceae bacterium]
MLLDFDLKPSDKLAAIDDAGAQLTYGDLVALRGQLSSVLPPRELVFCLCENRVGALAGFLALYDCKDVCLLLSAHIDSGLLAALCETYHPSYFWMPESKAPEFNYDIVHRFHGYVLCKTGQQAPAMHVDLSMLMTTSGTTGSPKLVRHKYGNIESNARNVASVFGWTEDERGIIDLPMQYTMGLNVILSHLYAGAMVLLAEANLMSPKLWQFIKEKKGTNLTGVPFSYEILQRLRFTRMDLPYLTTLAEGGGKLPDSLFKTFAEYAEVSGKRFFATFGTTETSARLAYLPPKDAATHIGSIGQAIPEGKLLLVDDDGCEITQSDQEGELLYEGPNVTMGYGTCIEDLQKGDEFCGVYATGDIARRDDDGYFYIVGRKKRFLKLYGLRVSLDQSEKIISEHFGVECACTGDDTQMRIYVTDAHLVEDVQNLMVEKTGLKAKSFEVKAIDAIPRFESGKVNYRLLS